MAKKITKPEWVCIQGTWVYYAPPNIYGEVYQGESGLYGYYRDENGMWILHEFTSKSQEKAKTFIAKKVDKWMESSIP